jgi:hypothetical protein
VNALPAASASAPEPWPSWLGDHHDLLSFLRREGLAISLHREIRVLAALDELRQTKIEWSSPAVVARWLAPILCSNAHDQGRVSELVARYAVLSTAEQPRAPTLVGGLSRETSQLIDQAQRHLPTGWIAAVMGAVLAAVIGYALWVAIASAPIPPPEKSDAGNGGGTLPKVGETLESGAEQGRFIIGHLAVASIPAGGSILFVVWWRRRRIALSRRSLRGLREGQRFDLKETGRAYFDAPGSRNVVRLLAAHRSVPSRRINARRTVYATVRAGGRVRFRFDRRPALPEYLLLVERGASFDHVGLLGDMIADRLVRGSVHLTRYDFDQDPRVLRPQVGSRFESLAEVASRLQGQRLIVVGDGARFLGADGEPRRWLRPILECFSSAAVLTPAPMAVWGPREAQLAAAGFRVHPATIGGLEALAVELTRSEDAPPPAPITAKRRHGDVIGQLERNRDRWLSNTAPDEADVNRLFATLRSWLGEDGFVLLAGIALFPEIRGEVTLGLADALGKQRGEPVVDGALLADIARLPWLRHGRMPDWLRTALLHALPPRSAREIRKTFIDILADAREASRDESMELVRGQSALVSGDDDPTPIDEPKERITWDFLRGRDLELEVPLSFSRLIKPRFDWAEWIVLGVGAVGALALGLFDSALFHKLMDFGDGAAHWLVGGIGASTLCAIVRFLAILSIALRLAQACSWSLALRVPSIAAPVSAALSLLLAGAFRLEADDERIAGLSFLGGFALFTALAVRAGPPKAAKSAVAPSLAHLFRGDRWWVTTLVTTVPIYALFASGAPLSRVEDDIEIFHLIALAILISSLSIRLRLNWYTAAACIAGVGGARLLPPAFMGVFGDALEMAFPMPSLPAPEIIAAHLVLPFEVVAASFCLWRTGLIGSGSALRKGVASLAATAALGFVPRETLAMGVLTPGFLGLALIVIATFRADAPAERSEGGTQAVISSPKRRRWPLLVLIAASFAPLTVGAVLAGSADIFATTVRDEVALAVLGTAFLPAAALWPTLRLMYHHLHTLPQTEFSSWDVVGSRGSFVAWPLLAALLSISYRFDGLVIDLSPLWPVAAAYLGSRLGRRGFQLVALAASPLLISADFPFASPTSYTDFNVSTAGNPGLYVAALIVCRLFGQAAYRAGCLAADRMAVRNGAFLFVVLATSIAWSPRGLASHFMLQYKPEAYFWLVFLLIGMSAIRLRDVVGLLVVAATVGSALQLGDVGLTLTETPLRYAPILPRDVVTGMIVLWCGRLIRDRLLGSHDAASRLQVARSGAPIAILSPRWTSILLPLALGLTILASVLGSPVAPVDGTTGAVLLFTCGVVGGARAAGRAIAVYIAASLLVYAVTYWTGGPILELHLNLGYGSFGSYVKSGLFRGHVPLDAVFAVFGWLVHRRIGQGSILSTLDQHLRALRLSPRDSRTLPALRFRVMDRIWSLIVGATWLCAMLLYAIRYWL